MTNRPLLLHSENSQQGRKRMIKMSETVEDSYTLFGPATLQMSLPLVYSSKLADIAKWLNYF